MSIKPRVSVIITTKNEESHIESCLRSIKEQNYKNIEIIVVDNNSSDNTKTIAKRYTDLVYEKGPERSAQRNFGAERSSGEFLMFIDADMILNPNVISECVNKSNEFQAIIIPEKSIGKGYWASVKAFERSLYEGDSSIEAARFFSKIVFVKYKGYDESITGPEDWDLPKRISKEHKIGRIKDYIFHDEGKVSLSVLMKKKYYYGLKTSRYIKKHAITETSTQLIYFLRPAFYKNWKKLLLNPKLSLGLVVMLSAEQLAGGCGVARGSFKK